MLRSGLVAAVLVVALWPVGADAAQKTVVLNIDNASCQLCGPIVKKALSRVGGVKSVRVQEASAQSGAVATVTYDDAAANVSQLIAASANAGYPAQLRHAK